MGTLVRITVYTPESADAARQAFRAGFDRIRDLDADLSDYKPDSELNPSYGRPSAGPARQPRSLRGACQAAQELAEATGGAFDVTQGPVIRLWRQARRGGASARRPALGEAAARTGFRKLRLDDAQRHGHSSIREGMALDVGGIAKGYAASEALARIGALGVRSAMVAVSGDLAFSDAPPGHARLAHRAARPDRRAAGVPAILELTNAAVSTAGTARTAPRRRRPPLLPHRRSGDRAWD